MVGWFVGLLAAWLVGWLVDGFKCSGDYGRQGRAVARGREVSCQGERGLASLVVGRQPLTQAVLGERFFSIPLFHLQRRRDHITEAAESVCAEMQVDEVLHCIIFG